MINMKMSKEEAKEATPGEVSPADAPKYPYGLTICLDEDAMKKLSMGDLPKVGTVMHLTARVEVCSTSQYSTQGGEPESNLSLQITDMELGAAQAESAQRLYPNMNP